MIDGATPVPSPDHVGGGLTPRAGNLPGEVKPSPWIGTPQDPGIIPAMFESTDVVNALRWLEYKSTPFKPQPGYNPLDTIKDTKYEQNYLDRFVGSESEAQTHAIMSRIDREESVGDVLSRGGFFGTVAGLASGMISPTMLLPAGGIIREAGIVKKAAEGAALTAAAVAAQEGVLQATTETRTPAESAFSISAGAVLGGILGGAFGRLSKGEAQAGEKAIANMPGTDEAFAEAGNKLLGEPAPAGAAVTATDRGAMEIKGAGLERTPIKNQDPLFRTMTSPFKAARIANADLNEIPVTMKGNAEGIATSPGGSVEALAHDYDWPLADAMGHMESQYQQYFFGKPDNWFPRMRSGLATTFGQAGGKMPFSQFKEAVFDAMHSGDVHPVPEVEAAARYIRSKIEDPLKKEAIQAGLFTEDVKPGDDVSHVFRMWDTKAVAADREGLAKILTDDFVARQAGVQRQIEGIGKKVEEKQFEIDQRQAQIEDALQRFNARRSELAVQAKAAKGDVAASAKELNAKTQAAATEQRSLSRAQRSQYATLLADVKRGRPAGVGSQDINQFIRSKGGMRLERLDATGNAKFKTAYGAEIMQVLGGKGRGIVNKAGVDPDLMLRMAVDEGYLAPGADLNDLVSAIDDTLKGRPVHSQLDAADIAAIDSVRALAAEIDRAGLDVSKMTPEDLAKFMGAPERASSPALRSMYAEIQDIADRFDNATLKVSDIERLADDLKEMAPDLVESSRAMRTANRETGKAMRSLQRQIAERQSFADMSAEEIRSLAEQSIDTILGFSPDRAMLPKDIIAGPRGPLKERMLRVPTAKVRNYVVRDIAAVERAMTKTMATDIAFTKKFGDTNLSGVIGQINDEAAAMIRKAPSRSAEITRAQKRAIRDLTAMAERQRGLYGMPNNPDGLLHRAVRVILNHNYIAKLGNVTVSSISDIAKPLMNYGLNNSLKTIFHPLVNGTKTIKLAAKEAKLAGAALDRSNHARQMSINDVMDNYGRGNRFEKAHQWLTDRFGGLSLMDHWNTAMKEFAGTVAQTQMLKAIERVAKGTNSGKDIEKLAADSIDGPMADRIAKQLRHVVKDGDVWAANTEAWTDPAAVRAMRHALRREINRTIVTPGQDKPLWMSRELGRVVGQFHSFNVASVQRTVMAGLQARDAAALNGALLMLGLGYLAYYLKGQISGKGISDNPSDWALNAFDNSGLGGWIMDANNIATKLSGGAVSIQRFIGAQEPSRYQAQDLSGLFGPTVGTIASVAKLIGSAGRGQWTESQTHQLRQLIPLQNLFYLRWLFDSAEKGANGVFGVPKKAA